MVKLALKYLFKVVGYLKAEYFGEKMESVQKRRKQSNFSSVWGLWHIENKILSKSDGVRFCAEEQILCRLTEPPGTEYIDYGHVCAPLESNRKVLGHKIWSYSRMLHFILNIILRS